MLRYIRASEMKIRNLEIRIHTRLGMQMVNLKYEYREENLQNELPLPYVLMRNVKLKF